MPFSLFSFHSALHPQPASAIKSRLPLNSPWNLSWCPELWPLRCRVVTCYVCWCSSWTKLPDDYGTNNLRITAGSDSGTWTQMQHRGVVTKVVTASAPVAPLHRPSLRMNSSWSPRWHQAETHMCSSPSSIQMRGKTKLDVHSDSLTRTSCPQPSVVHVHQVDTSSLSRSWTQRTKWDWEGGNIVSLSPALLGLVCTSRLGRDLTFMRPQTSSQDHLPPLKHWSLPKQRESNSSLTQV